MRKVLLQFSVLVIVFVGTWLLLGRIDFMDHFHVAEMSKTMEQKLGDKLLENITKHNREIETDAVKYVLDTIKNRLCYANSIDPDDIHIHLVRSKEVNAFAMPGNHIVVYTGLIQYCDSPSELSGVLAHEMSHIELHHIMKGLASQIGISVLAAVASNGNSVVVGRIIKLLSSSAYQRTQEREADANGVKYLERAHIDPIGLANMMKKFAKLQSDIPKEMTWISNHPDSKEREAAIRQLAATYDTTEFAPIVTDERWQAFKDAAANR